jgi:hypothetical protein
MSLTYIQAVGAGFPAVQCHALGDGSIYADLVWDSGDPIPSQATLDAWISANPSASGVVLTKYQFRQLFTLDERVAIDNVQSNVNITANYKAILYTMSLDMQLSGEVELSNPDVMSGVDLLQSLGLIVTGRAAQILSNTMPIPINSVAPAVTGTSQSGQVLTTTSGTWNTATSYTYQWMQNSTTPITGATNNTYTIQTTDIGSTLSCNVTAINTYGSMTASSNIIAAPTM